MVEPPEEPEPPKLMAMPRAIAIEVAPACRVFGGDGRVDGVVGDLVDRDEGAPAGLRVGDLLQQDAVAIEDAGGLKGAGDDVGRVRQAVVDVTVGLHRAGDRADRRDDGEEHETDEGKRDAASEDGDGEKEAVVGTSLAPDATEKRRGEPCAAPGSRRGRVTTGVRTGAGVSGGASGDAASAHVWALRNDDRGSFARIWQAT